MTRSGLLNKLRTEKTEENKNLHNKRRNFCVNVFRKKNFFHDLNVKCIANNKLFLKVVKTYLSNESTKSEKNNFSRRKQSNHHR